MNKRYLPILFSLISFIAFTNPREHVIVVDMDEVFVDARKWSIGADIIAMGIFKWPSFLWNTTFNKKFKKRFKTISDGTSLQTGESIHGFTCKVAEIARIYKPLRPLFDRLVRSVHSKRKLAKDVIALFKKLKDHGYTIIVATNRDRIGFEITANALKFDQLYNGERLFDAVIVSQEFDFVKTTTIGKKRFSRINQKAKLDGYITNAQCHKPDKAYYEIVKDVVNAYATAHQDQFDTAEPQIIFFDDKQENIDGANNSNLDITAYQVPEKKRALSMMHNLQQCCNIRIS